MAKRSDILKDLHNIISDKLNPMNESNNLGFRKILNNALNESQSYPEVLSFLDTYNKRLNEGMDEAMLLESFRDDLRIKAMNDENHGIYSRLAKKLNEEMNLGIQQQNVINDMISPYQVGNTGGEVYKVNGNTFIEDENGNLTPVNVINKESIFEAVDEYIDNRINEEKTAKEQADKSKRTYKDIDNNIRLAESISRVLGKHRDNKYIVETLNPYISALSDGCREEMLYETYMQKLHESFSYLADVEKEINDMQKRVSGKQVNIMLTKIMEAMSNDGEYYYLVPLLEDNVTAYMEDPNPTNRNILFNICHLYENCPYVIEIMTAVNSNRSMSGMLVKESADFIKNKAHIESVYSPVQYIKENECIFNVEGQFYVKKGQHISKLAKESLKNLSESFMALSKLVNDPKVIINEDENTITLCGPSNSFIEINEDCVKIGDSVETASTLKKLDEMHLKYSNFDDITYLTAAFLQENFNNIAKIDFVKTIALNESDAKTLDLFRIKNNIFVAAHDNINEEHTFYRNVKPIQLKNIINEHFGINVSSLFEDLLPNQDKILNELDSVKTEYEEKINKLMESIQKLKVAEAEATDRNEWLKIGSKIYDLNEELEDVKDEYLDFQYKMDEMKHPSAKDTDVESDALNDAKQVIDVRDVDGSEDDGSDGSDELDEIGFDDFDFDGLDSSDEFGSDDYENSEDDYISSDGDDLSQPISDTDVDEDEIGSDAAFTVDPFSEITDNTDNETEDIPEIETKDDIAASADETDDPFGSLAMSNDEESHEDEAENETDTEEKISDDATLDFQNFRIVKVDFDKNIKTGEHKSTGKVIVVVPWIDAEGNQTSETKSIDFYIADINNEKSVVLNTEGMTLEMYKAVQDAVKQSPDFNVSEPTDEPEKPVSEPVNQPEDNLDDLLNDVPDTIDDVLPTPEELNAPQSEDNLVDSSDETTVLTMDDGVMPTGIVTPSYMDGDTEIDMPADNISLDGEVPGDDIITDKPKSGMIEKITPEFESMFGNISSDNKLNEDVNIGVDDSDDGSDNLVLGQKQDDPISVIADTLQAYQEETEDEAFISDITDWDIDGKTVSQVSATLGGEEVTFFTLDGKAYTCPSQDFDEASDTIDSLEDYISNGIENGDVSEIEDTDDTEALVEFVTDTIKTTTGEDFDYEVEGDKPDTDTDDIDSVDEAKVLVKKN